MTLVVLATLLGGGVILAGARRRVFIRSAIRDVIRRPGQTMLVAGGLVVASLVIASSMVAANSLSLLVRKGVEDFWGPVDLEVTTFSGRLFSMSRVESVLGDGRVERASDGRASRLRIVGSADSRRSSAVDSRVNLIGVDRAQDASLGPLDRASPRLFPRAGSVVINRRLAKSLRVRAGDSMTLLAGTLGKSIRIRLLVQAVVPDRGKANFELGRNAFAELGFVRRSTGFSGVNQILLSAAGDTASARRRLATAVEDVTGPMRGGPFALEISRSREQSLRDSDADAAFLKAILVTLGALVALTSIGLIVNLFIMLGEERRIDLATMRALGLRRRGLVLLMMTEGVIYSIAPAVGGALLGAVLGKRLGAELNDIYQLFTGEAAAGTSVAGPAPWGILAGAAAAGFLISSLTAALVAFRTSRLNVAMAIRGIGERSGRVRRGIPVVSILALSAGAGLLLLPGFGRAAGGALVAAGGGGVASALLRNPRRGATLGGSAALIWGLGSMALADVNAASDFRRAFTLFVLMGIVSVVGAVIVIAVNLELPSRLAGRMRLVLGPAMKNAAALRLRTGLGVGMFAMVIFMISAFSVWGGLAGGDFEVQSGGFDVVAHSAAGVRSLEVPSGVAFGLYSARYEKGYRFAGGRELDRPVVLYGVGRDFAEGNEFSVLRAPEGATPRRVWERLLSEEMTVIPDTGSMIGEVGPGSRLILKTDRNQVELRVIGVAEESMFQGLFMSKQTFENLYPTRAVNTAWFIQATSGVTSRALAASVEKANPGKGLDAVELIEVFNQVAETQRAFAGLFQVLLRFGLVIGISSLAIVALRSVIERRRQVGILRAMGYRRWMVAAWFLSEHLVIATLGSAAGLLIGLLGPFLLLMGQLPGLDFEVDLSQTRLALGLVYGAVVLTTVVPALRAASLPPARAIRHFE